jgi:hypothetical protein
MGRRINLRTHRVLDLSSGRLYAIGQTLHTPGAGGPYTIRGFFVMRRGGHVFMTGKHERCDGQTVRLVGRPGDLIVYREEGARS